METFAFHLMPYRASDDEAWPFPGDDWDPELGARYYREYVDTLTLAGELGFDGLAFNEHHYSTYGLMPSPVVMAATLAERTESATIAFFGNVLPIRRNPIRLAEELAMLDTLTEGRVLAGFARGIPVEYQAAGIDYDESRGRLWEALELVRETWTAEAPFDHHGEFYDFEGVYAWPRPYQRPHPPIWMPATSDESVRAIAERGLQLGTGFAPAEALAERLARYDEVARAAGHDPAPTDTTVIRQVYVAEDMATAREEAEPHLARFRRHVLDTNLGAIGRAMDGAYDPDRRDVYAQELPPHVAAFRDWDFETANERGTVIVGDPEYVAAEIERQHEIAGFGRLALHAQISTMPPALSETSLRLYADSVMPRVAAL